jgi:hypothetical protein
MSSYETYFCHLDQQENFVTSVFWFGLCGSVGQISNGFLTSFGMTRSGLLRELPEVRI